jgi:hypothetical protein
MLKFPLPRSIRAAGYALCAMAMILIFAGQTFADEEIPKFTDPEVTAYVKSYAEFTEQYIAATKAAKAGDNSKLAGVDATSQKLQAMSGGFATKLRPEETEKFTDFLSRCAEKMVNASL